jgi:hypothetical protein
MLDLPTRFASTAAALAPGISGAPAPVLALDGVAVAGRTLALLARALAGSPALLVLEDLGRALLPGDLAAVRAALRVATAVAGCSVLLSTDQPRLAALADSVPEPGHAVSRHQLASPGLRLGGVEAGRWHAPLAGFRRLRSTLAARVDEARELIAQHFARATRATDPPGACILWLEFPPAVCAIKLFRACLAAGVGGLSRRRSAAPC